MSDKTKHLKPGDVIWCARGITNYEQEPYVNWTILENSYKSGDLTCTIKLTNKGKYQSESQNDQPEIIDIVTVSTDWEICMVHDSTIEFDEFEVVDEDF